MWPNPQFPADLVTFTEVMLNGKLHFLCSACFALKALIFYFSFCQLILLLKILYRDTLFAAPERYLLKSDDEENKTYLELSECHVPIFG